MDEKVYQQEYEAKWVLVTESLVFSSFDMNKNTFDPTILPITKDSFIIGGLDIGAVDATAYVLVYVENGKYYVFDGFELMNMDEERIAKEIKSIEGKYGIQPKVRYIDPSAKLTAIGLANTHNIITYPAMNAIKESISLLNQLFRQNKLFISKNMQQLLSQLQTMEWKENASDKSPDPFKRVKGHHFDLIAALRYAVYSHYKQNSDMEIVVL